MAVTVTNRKAMSSRGRRFAPSARGELPDVVPNPSAIDAAEPLPATVRLTRRHRTQQIADILRITLEDALWLIQPLVLGLAINDALSGSYSGLMLFAALRLAYVLARVSRQMAATRALTQNPDAAAIGIEQPSPGNGQLRLRAVICVTGSLLMLAWYDVTLVPLCLLLFLPAGLLHAAFLCQVSPSREALDVEGSLASAVLSAGEPRASFGQTDAVRRSGVSATDAGVLRFALMELFVIGLLSTALVQYCSRGFPAMGGPIRAGDIFAVVSYILVFVKSVDMLPGLTRSAKVRGNPECLDRVSAD